MKLRGDLAAKLGDFSLRTGPFDLQLAGVTAIFGRSGAGKSSFLQALGGHLPQVTGTLQLGHEACWQLPQQVPPAHQRGIALVHQQPGLFPHLSVAGNLQFAAKRSAAKPAQISQVAQQCGISELMPRHVAGLSGGEAQRVAIARALLSQPRLLCLDEPLSALDWAARSQLMDLIQSVSQDFDLPILYVTHDAAEVERIASQVIHMQAGRLAGVESLQSAVQRLDSPLFADQQVASVLFGQLSQPDEWGLAKFVTSQGASFRLLAAQARPAAARLRIQARDISLARQPVSKISVLNQLAVTVQQLAEPKNGRVLVRLCLNEQDSLVAEITAWSAQQLALKPGDQVFALVKSVALIDE